MSMGQWAENAQTDESDLIAQAVQEGRKALEAAKSDTLAELQALAAEVFGTDTSPKRRKGRPKGGSVVNRSKFPYRDESAERNFRVLYWDSDIRHIEYSPVKRYKGEVVDDVDHYDVRGHSETIDTMDPLDIICIKETIRERTSKMAFPENLLKR